MRDLWSFNTCVTLNTHTHTPLYKNQDSKETGGKSGSARSWGMGSLLGYLTLNKPLNPFIVVVCVSGGNFV